MKLLRIALALAVLSGSAVFAGPCVSGSLTSYVALGDTGCSIGPLNFFDFSFSVFSTVGGPATIGSDAVNITPNTNALFQPGFSYGSDGFTVNAGQEVVYLLAYSIDEPPIIHGFSQDLDTDPPMFPGLVDILSNLCIGAVFDDGVCPTSVIVTDVNDNGVTHNDFSSVTISPAVGVLGVRTLITLNALQGGSATFTSVGEDALVAPEPSTTVLAAAGVLLLLFLKRDAVRSRFESRKIRL